MDIPLICDAGLVGCQTCGYHS